MTDRELLELAAKAAGLDTPRYADGSLGGRIGISTETGEYCQRLWNPLTDDGDALRLAVRLELMVNINSAHTQVTWHDEVLSESHDIEQWDNGMTPCEWTRRAIVRAAAAIGEMK